MPILVLDDDRLTAYLERLHQQLEVTQLRDFIEAVQEDVQRLSKLQYPPQSNTPLAKRYRWPGSRRWHKFKSPQHQRGFFALLKAGKIQIPYRRRFLLQRSLDIQVTAHALGDRYVLLMKFFIPDNRRASRYAPFVIGQPQSRYFRVRTRWQPLTEMLQSRRQGYIEVAVTALDRQYRRLGVN